MSSLPIEKKLKINRKNIDTRYKTNSLSTALSPIIITHNNIKSNGKSHIISKNQKHPPTPLLVPQEIKLQPEGKVTTTSGNFDCVCLMIHCAQHQQVLVTKQNGAIWMPYAQMAPHRSWKHNVLFGLCLCLTGSNTIKFNALKSNLLSHTSELKCLEIFRMQLPQSLKFIKRITYYVKLKPNFSNSINFKCCQADVAPHLEWLSLEEIVVGKMSQLWGPELVEFGQMLSVQGIDNHHERITEFSLEEAFLFMPRDPPQNLGEHLLKSICVTGNDIERLYADFIQHCFPSMYQTENSFKYFLFKYDFEKDHQRLLRLFHAFNFGENGFLSFHELLLGLACLEPSSVHNVYRIKLIFRYYDIDRSGGLNLDELRSFLLDLVVQPNQVDLKLQQLVTNVPFKWNRSKQEVLESDFIAAVVDNRISGTSSLCRSIKSIFAQIARSFVFRSANQTRFQSKKILSSMINSKKCNDGGE